MIFLRSLLPVAVTLLLAVVMGWLFGAVAAAWFLASAWLAHAIYHGGHLAALHEWAALPDKRHLPLGLGVWTQALERLSRNARREREDRVELEAELERVRAAVNELPDAIVLLDRFDQIEWCNTAAGLLHGVVGRRRPIHHYIRDPEFAAWLQAGAAAPALIQTPAFAPDRTLQFSLLPMPDGRRVLITLDITDLTKLDAMRRDFVANVSHEIRTPVTVIGGFAETLLDLDLDETSRREYLRAILAQALTLQRLVTDLLTLASLDRTPDPTTEADVTMAALVRAQAADALALSQGEHEIIQRIESDWALRGVPTEIESAVRNLVTNAVRYTQAGGRIEIAWQGDASEGLLSVADTGIGISREHVPRLTERFYRVDRSRSRETGGTGLGLAIVKHVMQRHGGQLDIASEPGKGSRFTLRFPAHRMIAPATHEVAAGLDRF